MPEINILYLISYILMHMQEKSTFFELCARLAMHTLSISITIRNAILSTRMVILNLILENA